MLNIWDEHLWLPEGVSWEDMKSNATITYPRPADLKYTFLGGFVLLVCPLHPKNKGASFPGAANRLGEFCVHSPRVDGRLDTAAPPLPHLGTFIRYFLLFSLSQYLSNRGCFQAGLLDDPSSNGWPSAAGGSPSTSVPGLPGSVSSLPLYIQ